MKLVYEHLTNIANGDALKKRLSDREVIVVKSFFDASTLAAFNNKLRDMLARKATWMPLDDACTDYRRINDEYPKSYVRARTHSFMIHFFNGMNQTLCKELDKLWRQKLAWDGLTKEKDIQQRLNAKPSDGYIPRLVSHLYPAGGGYLAPHRDPVNPYNPIQTLIVGSQFGQDFNNGGLFVHDNDGNHLHIDPYTKPGDLLMFDQSFTHEVKPIDSHRTLDWKSTNGRLQHVILFTRSDYLKGEVPDVVS